jgi:apolipoprotein N-acyltransferase
MYFRLTALFRNFSWRSASLAALSGVMLALAFPETDWWPLLWFGFVPLFLSQEGLSYRGVYWTSTLAGSVMIWISYPWIIYLAEVFIKLPRPLAYLVWVFAGFLISQLFGIAGLLSRFIGIHTKCPTPLIWPICLVTIWSIFPNLFYFNLANAVHGFPIALQGSSITGVFGLDFIVALTNTSIYTAIRWKKIETPTWSKAVGWPLVIIWFGFGVVSLSDWDEKISSWDKKKVGLVQTHRQSSFRRLKPEPGYSRLFPVEIEMSQKLAQQGADVVVWPEGHKFGYFSSQKIRDAFHAYALEMKMPMVIHDKGREERLFKGATDASRNSAILIRKDGTYGGIYHKRFLVAFGEYYPFEEYYKPIKKALGIGRGLTPGEKVVTFEAAGMKIQPLICYESMFSSFSAASLEEEGKGRVIFYQSNDGWYGRGAQTAQHRSSSVLRAVENRVPVVHVINDGQSHVINPNGRYAFLADDFVRGAYLAEMPYDAESGGSFFTRHPYWFMTFAWLALIALCFIGWRRKTAKSS